MARCRRKFFEALPAEKRKRKNYWTSIHEQHSRNLSFHRKMSTNTYLQRLELHTATNCSIWNVNSTISPDERKSKRLEQEVPSWDCFFKWIDTLNPTKGSTLQKTVNYTRNHRDSLRTYLQNSRCKLSNNVADEW